MHEHNYSRLIHIKNIVFDKQLQGLFIFLFSWNTKSGDEMKKLLYPIGLLVGFVNSLLGAGGGMVVVPALKNQKLSQQEAQATAIAVILPLTIISAIIYLVKGNVQIQQTLIYIPFGLIGSVVGAKILPKISNHILSLVFGGFLIWSAARLFFK